VNAASTRNPSTSLLHVEGLRASYGKAEVLQGMNFCVQPGEFVVMLGRNGAGKSTTLHALSGLIPKTAGTVRFKGEDISRLDSREIVRRGVVNVLEGHRVFTGLSVEDNLLLGTYARTRSGDRSKLARVYDLFPELAERRHQLASRLSGGQQQILAVGQGVIADPALLILDEPSGGLAPIVVDRILKVARQLCSTGIAILLVEQLVKEALKFADYCYLVESGLVGGEGTPDEVRAGETIKRIYLGG
jgi:branched-chain amino acid transport system ATP-binding protein